MSDRESIAYDVWYDRHMTVVGELEEARRAWCASCGGERPCAYCEPTASTVEGDTKLVTNSAYGNERSEP